MTLTMLAPTRLAPAMPTRHHLLADLDAATYASADAHEATRALTDTVLACQYLPAEIYKHAPYLSHALAAVTAATRTLTTVTGYATADPSPENGYALRRATADLAAATADLRDQIAALTTAVAWYTRSAALPPTTAITPPREPQL
ncbi:MAG: hypothetical protein HOW97_35750 [Catenulispora sp.]|nr:hypothetical protein [Catenulispora sp.]